VELGLQAEASSKAVEVLWPCARGQEDARPSPQEGHSKGACEGTELVTLAGNTGGGRSVA
jgi:hypothetical protein